MGWFWRIYNDLFYRWYLKTWSPNSSHAQSKPFNLRSRIYICSNVQTPLSYPNSLWCKEFQLTMSLEIAKLPHHYCRTPEFTPAIFRTKLRWNWIERTRFLNISRFQVRINTRADVTRYQQIQYGLARNEKLILDERGYSGSITWRFIRQIKTRTILHRQIIEYQGSSEPCPLAEFILW